MHQDHSLFVSPIDGLPDDPSVHSAFQAMNGGRWSEALSAFQTLLGQYPHRQSLIDVVNLIQTIIAGEEAMESGDVQTALSHFNAAVTRAPNFYRPYNLLGNAYLELGDYPAAENAYRQAVRLKPDYAPAHCNIGIARLAGGDIDGAIEHLTQATLIKPDFPYAWRSLADAFTAANRPDMAADALRKAIAVDPDAGDLLASLGQIEQGLGDTAEAITCFQAAVARGFDEPDFLLHVADMLLAQGRPDDAATLAERAAAAAPDDHYARFTLANCFHALGRFEDAVAAFRQAIAAEPNQAVYYCNLGNTLSALQRHAEAIEACRTAERLAPDMAEVHNNLAAALSGIGELEDALTHCNIALGLQPGFLGALLNRAAVLQLLDRLDEAQSDYQRILAQEPDNTRALCDLACCEFEIGNYTATESLAKRLLALKPSSYEGWRHLSNVHEKSGRLQAALECAIKAVDIAPDLRETWGHLGHIQMSRECFQEAIDAYERALTLPGKPEAEIIWSNLLFCHSVNPGTTPAQYLQVAKTAGEFFTRQVPADWPFPAPRQQARRLRVGFVSGDLRNHPVGYFIENILAFLKNIDLYAYPTHPEHNDDALTMRIRPMFKAWRPSKHTPTRKLAEQIRADEIDILIDLAGYTGLNRTPLFAWRVAPLQINWLGFFATTGIPAMDYLITDRVTSPPASNAYFTEKLWFLPVTRLCFSPPRADNCPVVAPSPASINGYVTFGCYQRSVKFNEATIARWARILARIPTARMIIKGSGVDASPAKERLLSWFDQAGISTSRITLEGPSTREAYLAQYARVDMMLDTYPFTGGTTTCEALWMGVPTLTLAGETMLQRQGASLMSAAGLADWVAETTDEFVEKGIRFASAPSQLAHLRNSLREQVHASPLMDSRRFASDLEHALEAMWKDRERQDE